MTLEDWPEKVRTMQRNWIGRSEGLQIRWELDPATRRKGESELEVYTTRPDTLFGASFMAIAADHPLAQGGSREQSRTRRLFRGVPPFGNIAGSARNGREEGL